MKHPLLYRKYGKRLLGIALSSFGLLLLWPLMICIAIAIKCDSRGSILFKQKRLGKEKKVFTIYKFRTMVMNADQIGGAHTYDGDPRITKVGAFLRKTSLDEIPQLINILRGDMCFLGPRPLLEEALEQYKEVAFFDKRFIVAPGLFCTVDVCFRAKATKEIQFEMDAQYINQLSFSLDIRVFFKTFLSVLRRDNIYKDPL